MEKPDRSHQIFSALSHPIRRRVIYRLLSGPAYITQLHEQSCSFSNFARHMKKLEDAGLTVREINGREHRFRISETLQADVMDCVNDLLVGGRL